MRRSSDQPKRKAARRPHASRMKTYSPPVAGNALATSASVSAPHSTKMPPKSHTESSGSGPGSLSAMPAGDRKIPEPIVEPMSTATALKRPSRRGSRDGAAAEGGWCALPLSIIQPRRLRGTLRARLAAHRMRRHISLIIPTFLSDAIFWLAAACCVFAQAAIVRSALRARAQRPDGSASPSRADRGRVDDRAGDHAGAGARAARGVRCIPRRRSRSYRKELSLKALRRLAYSTLGLAYALIVFGAIVRISGSGMGCGDHWPRCFGRWFPPHGPAHAGDRVDASRCSPRSRWRWSRCSCSWRSESASEPGVSGPRGVLRAALLAAALIVVQALLGMVTVRMGNTAWATVAHLLNGALLLAVLAATVLRAGGLGGAARASAPRRRERARREDPRRPRRSRSARCSLAGSRRRSRAPTAPARDFRSAADRCFPRFRRSTCSLRIAFSPFCSSSTCSAS